MTPKSFVHLMKLEAELLRNEIDSLKNAQSRFILITVSIITLMFTVFTILPQNKSTFNYSSSDISTQYSSFFIPIMWLLPLLLISPFSRMFYDKAIAITRMSGYYNVLEESMHEDFNHLGWERSRQLLRSSNLTSDSEITNFIQDYDIPNLEKYKPWKSISVFDKLIYFLSLFGGDFFSKNRPKTFYWRYAYMIFFLISLFSVFVSFYVFFRINFIIGEDIQLPTFNSNLIYSISIIFLFQLLFLTTSLLNLRTIYNLEYGAKSYKINVIVWEIIILERYKHKTILPIKSWLLNYCTITTNSEIKNFIKQVYGLDDIYIINSKLKKLYEKSNKLLDSKVKKQINIFINDFSQFNYIIHPIRHSQYEKYNSEIKYIHKLVTSCKINETCWIRSYSLITYYFIKSIYFSIKIKAIYHRDIHRKLRSKITKYCLLMIILYIFLIIPFLIYYCINIYQKY